MAREQRSVAVGNKVMDTRLPQTAGCGDEYDVSGFGYRLLRCARNDAERTNIVLKGLDVVRQYAALLERRVQTGTRARKALVVTRQANPLGRSMIEMLGVLAIIGVLSVGGIAGYSKAMEKFKVNKTVSEYSNFIFGMLEHLSDYQNLTQVDDGKQISLANTINNTVSVPPNWVLNGGFSDSNGNQLYIVSRNNRLVLDIYLGTISINDKGQFVSDNFSTNLCRELFLNLVQPIADTLYWARLYRAKEAVPVKFWGNKTCNGADRKCLQAITLSEIDATCKLCVKGDYCCIGLEF